MRGATPHPDDTAFEGEANPETESEEGVKSVTSCLSRRSSGEEEEPPVSD
jgi:hypothetical protein